MKNVFKKACVLGSAALLAMGMSSSMVGAVQPGENDLGIRYDDVSIGRGTLTWQPYFTLASGLTYDGTAKQLIEGMDTTHDGYAAIPNGATLYVRVADSEGASPADGTPWVAYANDESFATAALKRTASGTYHIYWYLDGGANNNDITAAP